MITVYLMTPEGPLGVPVKASTVKTTDRGFLQLYDATDHLIAIFAAWAYWLDSAAIEEKEAVLQ